MIVAIAICMAASRVDALVETHSPHASIVKHYPTLQAAYEALFEVWPRFAPAERERW